jgi:hypothetical protein
MNPLVLPQVNLNGTSREALVEQQCDVMHALQDVLTKMGAAAPNGRDYQFRPAEFKPAQQAWLERMTLIAKLHKEIETQALAIQDGA